MIVSLQHVKRGTVPFSSSGSIRKTVPSWLSIRSRVIHKFNEHSRTDGQLFYGEIRIDPAKLKMRKPLAFISARIWSVPEHALARLDLAGKMIPSLDWFLYAFVCKEAVISSQIEGKQATIIDLLTFEAENEAAVPPRRSYCPSRTDPVIDPAETVSAPERTPTLELCRSTKGSILPSWNCPTGQRIEHSQSHCAFHRKPETLPSEPNSLVLWKRADSANG